MLAVSAAEVRALAALAALLAVPGAALVRAPWRAAPLLSLSFWLLSWTWFLGSSRTRWLQTALAGLLVLALLRLLRYGVPRPGGAHAVLAAAGMAALVPFAFWTVGPGPRPPLEALSTLLLTWRDAWPPSFEPLVPQGPFRATGLALVAADVSLLSGVPPHRAELLVSLAAHAVMALGLWPLAAAGLSGAAGALVAVGAAAAAVCLGSTGSGALAVALVAAALSSWRDRLGLPSAVAVGACVAAAMAADPSTASIALLLCAAKARGRVSGRARPGHGRVRARVAVATALVLCVPLVVRRPPLEAPDLAALVGLAAALAVHVMAGGGALGPRAARAAAALAVAAIVGAAVVTVSAPRALERADVEVMERIRARTRPFDVVCAPDEARWRWVPAMAARPVALALGRGWPVPRGPCAVTIPSLLAPAGTSHLR